MIAPHKVLFTAMAVFAFPAVAAAQTEPAGNPPVRIEMLERRMEDLENRVRELENLLKALEAQNLGIPAPQTWWNVENWRRVRRGMSTTDIREVLGEPNRIEAIGRTVWYFGESPGGGYVLFDDRGRVEGWSEPRQ